MGSDMNAIDASPQPETALADLLAGRYPDERGRYGPYGGRYVPETLIPAHERLERGAALAHRSAIPERAQSGAA